MTTNSIYLVALIIWPVISILAFTVVKPRSAVLFLLLTGWLFLPRIPDGALNLPLIKNKFVFVSACVFLGSLFMDNARWRKFRLRWFDFPVVTYCLAAGVSSLTNDLGLYDAFSAVGEHILGWAAPYALGRVYFGDPKAIKQLALAIVAGGLVYVPFCLLEVRIGPTLHSTVYGIPAFPQFAQAIRYGGYRPTVFMQHGLMVGLWMASAALIAYWLWRSGAARNVWGLPMGLVFLLLLGTTVAVKSSGAIILLLIGMFITPLCQKLRTGIPLLILLAIPPSYGLARSMGWSGKPIAQLAERWSNADRAQSLEFRMQNEDILLEKALQQPIFGWGRWGRSRVYDANGKDISVTDGLWVIVIGTQGIVGLLAVLMMLSLPALIFIRLYPSGLWKNKHIAPAAALVLVLAIYSVDDVLNAMSNPVYHAAMGAVVELCWLAKHGRRSVGLMAPIARGDGPMVLSTEIQ